MIPALKDSLKLQSKCPACKFDWIEMEKSLYETILSPNFHIAVLRALNCPTCGERFKKELIDLGVR